MAYDAVAEQNVDKENADPNLNGDMSRLSLEKRRSPEKPGFPSGLKLTAEGLKPSTPKPQSIHQEFMDQALDMVCWNHLLLLTQKPITD